MKKPELADYGLKGIDSRPQIDVESSPISAEEEAAAYQAMLEWFVGNERVRKFRAHLNAYDWEVYDKENPL